MQHNKLIIQLPCFNEAETLPLTLKDLPRQVKGFRKVEWLIIDDGSSDNTAQVARDNGVDHVIVHTKNMGLAQAFRTGINSCLERGADVIVNTDADNQYCADDIEKLVTPIVENRADIVIGERPIWDHTEFKFLKKVLQKLGSHVVRLASKTVVKDAPSGFRAFSADVASQLNVYNSFTYTLETIIQAGRRGFHVENVPIRVNPTLRPSRLFRSSWDYILKSIFVIVQTNYIYRPFKMFFLSSLFFLLPGLFLGFRWLYYFLIIEDGRTRVPSIIVMNVLLVFGFLLLIIGLVTHLQSINRKLLEDIQYQVRRNRYKNQVELEED